MHCEVCGNDDLQMVLDLGSQPLCDDLIPIGDEHESERYPLRIVFCNNCHTALQEVNVDKKVLFPSTYHYRARNTPSVLSGMQNLVAQVCSIPGINLSNKKVLDIGCNDGSLLDFFAKEGCKTFGIDPTDAILDASSTHKTTKDFFSPFTALKLKEQIGFPDIITFTNCFAHIENMSELMTSLSCLMGPSTLVVIENHYLRSVLEKNQFDTFYHEHPRTYSAKSFSVIADLLGAKLIKTELTSRYGGNIRAFITRNHDMDDQGLVLEDYDYSSKFKDLSSFIPRWIRDKRSEIESEVAKNGPLTGIAFPGRASILINLLKLTPQELKATYEIKGSKKTGNYIPGTRIPILPEKELLKSSTNKPSTVLNLAWHIVADVENNLAQYDYNPRLINIL